MANNPHTPPTELTPQGQQVLVPGVTPVTLRDRLAVRMAAPSHQNAILMPNRGRVIMACSILPRAISLT